jgi:Zn-dependent protease with chaperone function
MASTPQAYHILAMRFEQEARRRPLLYRLRVALLGALGYAVVFGAVTLPFALLLTACLLLRGALGDHPMIASAAWMCPLLMGLTTLVLVALQTLWVALPRPAGYEMKREEAVPLFQEIDRLRGELKAPRFHRVLLTNEFTAGIHQASRWGILTENLLLLGVPLMASLSPDQFRAVLAHEISHTSRAHGTFGSWVYRVLQTWSQLLEACDGEDSRLLRLADRFLRWYGPYFRAASFAIRRACEFEADRAAAQVVGAEPIASALVATALVARRLAEVRADGIDSRTAHHWLNDALTRTSDVNDAHPSLAARLRTLGQSPAIPPLPAETAFERYLDHKAISLAERAGVQVVRVEGGADNGIRTLLHVPAAGPAPFVIALRPHDP